MQTKKALGIITCKREDYYNQIIDTTPFDDVDKVYVFDSSPDIEKYVKGNDKIQLIEHVGGATVGYAKNRLMEAMMEDGYENLFLQEGDIKLTDGNVFDAYIDTARASGIWGSLNYAWHGNGNKDASGNPVLKNNINLTDSVGLDFTHNGTASFSYINSNIIKVIGSHDEFYQNCWEHLDFHQAQSVKKLASYWWWFADIKDSHKYIQDLDDGSHGGSVIRKDEKWKSDMVEGAKHFESKYGFTPMGMPHATEEQVLVRIQYLMDKYSR